MKTNLSFNYNIYLLFIGLCISCQKNTDLDPIPNHSYTNLAQIEADDSNQRVAAFRKIRRTPYSFEIKYQSETLMNDWKGVYSLPSGYELTCHKLIYTPQAELFLFGIMSDKNQKHIAVIKFDSKGEMLWNTLLQTTGNYKIEHAFEALGDVYFVSEIEDYLGNNKYYINRIESTGDLTYTRHFVQSNGVALELNLTKVNDQMDFVIKFDNNLSSIFISKKDGEINKFKLSQNSTAFITSNAHHIQFIQRSIPIRRLIEGKYPQISHNQTQMASLD